jgi:hypothetical protein
MTENRLFEHTAVLLTWRGVGFGVCKMTGSIKLLNINNVQALFRALLPDIRRSSGLFEGSEDSPACPSDESNIKIMEH